MAPFVLSNESIILSLSMSLCNELEVCACGAESSVVLTLKKSHKNIGREDRKPSVNFTGGQDWLF